MPLDPETTAPRAAILRRLLLPLLKLAVGVGLVVLLLRRQDLHLADLAQTVQNLSASPAWLAVTLLLVLLCLLCGAVRWWCALDGLGVRVSRARAAALFLVGHFFNGFLPGSTGGDVARAFYVARETHGHRALAVMTIVIERLAGVAVLLLLALGGLLATAEYVRLPLAVAITGLLAAAILLTLLGVPALSRVAHWPIARTVLHHPRIGPLAHKFYTALRVGYDQPRLILRLLGWSLLQHGFAVASWLTLAWGLGLSCHTLPFLLLVPVVLTAQMLPLTPGGLGVREGAALLVLPEAGLAPHAAMVLSLASFAVSLIWSAAGGVVFVLLKERSAGKVIGH
jgi:uncharacterized protein (TIRG00374 family)